MQRKKDMYNNSLIKKFKQFLFSQFYQMLEN